MWIKRWQLTRDQDWPFRVELEESVDGGVCNYQQLKGRRICQHLNVKCTEHRVDIISDKNFSSKLHY